MVIDVSIRAGWVEFGFDMGRVCVKEKEHAEMRGLSCGELGRVLVGRLDKTMVSLETG